MNDLLSHPALTAAGAAVGALLLYEVVLLARFLGWRRDVPGAPDRSPAPRGPWLVPLVFAVAVALPAAFLAQGGALAPGLSAAGMPWERVTDATPLPEAVRAGERAYLNRCSPCHLPEGTGLPPSYPSLVGSPRVNGPVDDHVRMVLWGSAGLPARRPGAAVMPAFAGALSDAELAAILTYERNSWGHAAGQARPSDVARVRAAGAPRP